jgi:hypothetical protein
LNQHPAVYNGPGSRFLDGGKRVTEEQTPKPAAGYEGDSVEDLLEQAQSNAQATIIATVGFLLVRQIPVEDWATFLGRTFGHAWEEPTPWEAGEFLDAMLTNFRSLGAVVASADLGPDRAQAVLTGFPDPELCELFAVPRAEAAEYCSVPCYIAEARSLTWTWSRAHDEITLLVIRNPAE